MCTHFFIGHFFEIMWYKETNDILFQKGPLENDKSAYCNTLHRTNNCMGIIFMTFRHIWRPAKLIIL